MSLRSSVAAVVLASAGWVGGCGATEREPQWVTAEIACPSEQVLWEFLLLSLNRSGFPLGMDVDPAERKLKSGWRTSLAPFKGKGWREKATVEYDRIRTGLYDVRVAVQREINNDLLRPLDPSFAQWEETDDNLEHAQHVLTFLESFIGADLSLDELKGSRRE